jgi:hypothetical protein
VSHLNKGVTFTSLSDISTEIGLKLYKNDLKTENGIFSLGQTTQTSFIEASESLTPTHQYLSSDAYFQLQIALSPSITTTYLHRYTFLQFLCDIGGLVMIVKLLGHLLVSSFAKALY